MRLHFTLGYHPEGDGQMECANQVLEQYLRVYTNYQQDDWATLLPMAEFAYNNAMNATTGVSPFFTNKGYHPEFTADPQVETSSAEAQAFVVDLECVQVELKENIAQAQERYWENVDKHRMEAADRKIAYTTWYIEQVMTVPMSKLHGYHHETSPIPPNSTSYPTNDTPISRAPRIAERDFPIPRRIAARPPASFLFLSYFSFL